MNRRESFGELCLPSDPSGNLSLSTERPDSCQSCLILSPSGYIDGSNIEYFRQLVEGIQHSGILHIVISFAGIPTTRSSVVLSYLVEQTQSMEASGGSLVLVGVDPKLKEILKLLSIDGRLIILGTVDEALARIRNQHG